MQDETTREAFKFFAEQAGGWVGHNAETALHLARAEAVLRREVEEGRATVRWEWDDQPFETDLMPDEEIAANFESGRWDGPFIVLVSVDGEIAAVLGGVTLAGLRTGRRKYGTSQDSETLGDGWSPDPYARVIEAELASEALEALNAPLSTRRTLAPILGNVAA